jgi:hypothetical protein
MVDPSLFDFPTIFGRIQSTNGLKRNQTRPLRSEIIERTLAKYSGGQFKYIGDKSNGVDFLDNENLRYELKCMDGLFQKSVPYTKQITLKNFFGTASELDQTFDFLILIDTIKNTIGVCDWECATRDMVLNDATITTKVQHDDVTFFASNVIPNTFEDMSHTLERFIQESI